MNISKITLFEICNNYYNLCNDKGGYYSRKESISIIYDHFYMKFKYQLGYLTECDIKILASNIIHTSSNKFKTIKLTKTNHSLSHRNIIVPSIYNVLYYELTIYNIFHIIRNIFTQHHQLRETLVNLKYVGYAHKNNVLLDNIEVEHYLDGWLEYNDKTLELKNEYKYILKTDIRSFYDSISHNLLIDLLKDFISEYYSEKNIEYINNILSELHNNLFKVSGLKNHGLPIGIISSDILSQLFLYLIFNSNDGCKVKNGIISAINGQVKIIHYADDFILFSKKEKNLYKGFAFLSSLLESKELLLNKSKTTDIILTSKINEKLSFNLNKAKNGDSDELELLLDLIISLLSEEYDSINISKLKTTFKFYYLAHFHKLKNKKDFLLKILKIFNFFNANKIEAFKKLSLLVVISASNTAKLIYDISKCYPDKKIPTKIAQNYIHEYDLYISKLNLCFLYRSIVNLQGLDEIKNSINSILINEDKFYMSVCDVNKKDYLIPHMIENNFFKLYYLLYTDNTSITHENSIGIKISDIFDIDIVTTQEIFSLNYFSKITNSESKGEGIFRVLQPILNNLSNLKDTNRLFYLKNPSFISDFYSLINILLTILHSLEYGKYETIKISGNKISVLNNSNNKQVQQLLRTAKITSRYGVFLLYITTYRAQLNHKENDIRIKDSIHYTAFKNYNNLYLNMKSLLSDIIKEINEINKYKRLI